MFACGQAGAKKLTTYGTDGQDRHSGFATGAFQGWRMRTADSYRIKAAEFYAQAQRATSLRPHVRVQFENLAKPTCAWLSRPTAMPRLTLCTSRHRCPLWARSGHDAIYSITSLARVSSEGGSLRPSALPLEIESNWFSQR